MKVFSCMSSIRTQRSPKQLEQQLGMHSRELLPKIRWHVTHALPLPVREALHTARQTLLLDTSLPIRACLQSSRCNPLTYDL